MPLWPDVEKAILPNAVTGERKYVTVLFSDLSGYTILPQRLDPEENMEKGNVCFCYDLRNFDSL